MNKQDIFNRVWDHFVTKGGSASFRKHGGGTTCAYRGEDGARCAVGVLVPDELYRPEWDGAAVSVSTLARDSKSFAEMLEIVGCAEHLGLLGELQRAHDGASVYEGATFGRVIQKYLRHVADEHNLYIPVGPIDVPVPVERSAAERANAS